MPLASDIEILYEDAFLVAVAKPPRVASVPAEGIAAENTVMGIVQNMFAAKNLKPFLLHRLDYGTSGVLLFGKEEKNRAVLENILRDNRTKKVYAALLRGVPKGRLVKTRLAARSTDKVVYAETAFRVIHIFHVFRKQCALIEAEIRTGRKHQIRQHFAGMGCPVVMDDLYGDFAFNKSFRLGFRLGRMFLHAVWIDFFHPFLKKMIHIEAPLPPDLKLTIKRMHNKMN